MLTVSTMGWYKRLCRSPFPNPPHHPQGRMGLVLTTRRGMSSSGNVRGSPGPPATQGALNGCWPFTVPAVGSPDTDHGMRGLLTDSTSPRRLGTDLILVPADLLLITYYIILRCRPSDLLTSPRHHGTDLFML